MTFLLQRSKAVVLALTLLALSAGLVFGAMPPAAIPGLTNAAEHAGKTVPVAGNDEDLGENDDADDADGDVESNDDEDSDEDADEDSDEDADEDVESAEDGVEHCGTDPSALTPDELDAVKHGSVVCWAAHQTEWPEWFANHGAFVRCWAHQGKLDAASCTEDPTAEDGTDEGTEAEPTSDATRGGGHGKGHAKVHGEKGKAKGKHKQSA